MGLSGQSGRRRVLNEINVTPFVDVMLVLLIIFMVTAPMMQQGIDVELPEASNTGVTVNEEPLVLVVKKNRHIYIGSAEVEFASLREKLKAIFQTRRNKQIYLQADKSVDYGRVAEVMGEIRSAGVFNIGLITLPRQLK